jgi:hypothetical protein
VLTLELNLALGLICPFETLRPCSVTLRPTTDPAKVVFAVAASHSYSSVDGRPTVAPVVRPSDWSICAPITEQLGRQGEWPHLSPTFYSKPRHLRNSLSLAYLSPELFKASISFSLGNSFPFNFLLLIIIIFSDDRVFDYLPDSCASSSRLFEICSNRRASLDACAAREAHRSSWYVEMPKLSAQTHN